MPSETEPSPLGVIIVRGADLLGLLRMVRDGADPDVLYMECFANAPARGVGPESASQAIEDEFGGELP